MKSDSSKVIFNDQCQTPLDGLDGWTRGWVLHGNSQQISPEP